MLVRRGLPDERGSSIVESMIAFILMTSAALAIYPLFAKIKQQTKMGDVKQLCENVARGKLDEYRFGRLVKANDAATNQGDYAYMTTGMPQLNNLTTPTLSQSSVGAINSGQSGWASGFFYAKVRYNRFFPYACNGTSNATIFGATKPTLGMRECIGNNQVLSVTGDPAGPPTGCTSPSDQQIANEIPGFKLYVKLVQDTPWPIPAPSVGPSTGNAAKDLQFGAAAAAVSGVSYAGCPDFGDYSIPAPGTASPLYDFDGVQDGIKVTVTGVADIASQGIAQLGDVMATDVGRLVCSVSATIRPEATPARYYVSNDGRIYSIHGHGQNGAEGNWTLKSIYTQSGGSMLSGITSIAVHPRNLSVYVLRAGSITRYGNCGGVPLDCDPVSTTTKGVSDFGQSGWKTVQEWKVPPAITFIGVDFRSGKVYGLSGDRSQYYEIWADSSKTPLGSCSTCGSPASPTTAYVITSTPNFPLPPAPPPGQSWPMRLSGFFLSAEGDEAFVSDQSSRVQMGASVYNASVYRLTDYKLSSPIFTLPAAAVSFSD